MGRIVIFVALDAVVIPIFVAFDDAVVVILIVNEGPALGRQLLGNVPARFAPLGLLTPFRMVLVDHNTSLVSCALVAAFFARFSNNITIHATCFNFLFAIFQFLRRETDPMASSGLEGVTERADVGDRVDVGWVDESAVRPSYDLDPESSNNVVFVVHIVHRHLLTPCHSFFVNPSTPRRRRRKRETTDATLYLSSRHTPHACCSMFRAQEHLHETQMRLVWHRQVQLTLILITSPLIEESCQVPGINFEVASNELGTISSCIPERGHDIADVAASDEHEGVNPSAFGKIIDLQE